MEKQLRMYDGKVFGETVSQCGIENGDLDYRTLARIVGDCIFNNYVYEHTGYENWELTCGDEEGVEGEYLEIYQYYIITYSGYKFLERYTDEIVYYNEELDMYLWGITHFGTSWDYVLTDIQLVEG